MRNRPLFHWIPGTPPSIEAIQRIGSRFPRPVAPMGEAWFMSEKRKMFAELMTTPVSELPINYLQKCLWEIASGIGSFGDIDHWGDWFRYLLPDLIARTHEQWINRLLEDTITAFMAVFSKGLANVYHEFQQDILETLGRSLMKPELWMPSPVTPNDRLRSLPRFLLEESDGKLFVDCYGFTKTPTDLSASLFFCLKYLPTGDITSWVESILRIEHSQWRVSLLVWFLGIKQVLRRKPLTPEAIERARPEISWWNSHLLMVGQRDQFISSENVEIFLKEISLALTPVTLDEWELQLIDDRRLSDLPGFDQLMQQIRSIIT
jgi:hypothetical protein